MMLLPDLYLLSGPVYGIHQNIYGIDFPEKGELILVDCGLDEQDLSVLQMNLNRFSLEDRRITDVYVTHCHFDHCGNAAFFQESGAVIHVGEADLLSVKEGDVHTLDFAYGRPFPCVKEAASVEDGEIFTLPEGRMKALHVPGHSAGSICYLLERNGLSVLFTGDFLQITPQGTVIPGIKVDPSYDASAYLSSAERMKVLQPDYVLCGHYAPCLVRQGNFTGQLYRELLVNRSLYTD